MAKLPLEWYIIDRGDTMKKNLYSLLLVILTFISLAYALILKRGHHLNLDMSITYFITAILITFIITLGFTLNAKVFATTFLIVHAIALLYLVVAMPKESVGFSDLGVFISWGIIEIIGLATGFIAELTNYIMKRRAR